MRNDWNENLFDDPEVNAYDSDWIDSDSRRRAMEKGFAGITDAATREFSMQGINDILNM